jgi:hypothetical protein
VVGGVAVNLHGAERMTSDVDLMLSLDAENLKRFSSAIDGFGFKPIVPVTLEQLCDAETIDRWVREKHMLAFALHPRGETAPTIDILVKTVVSFDDAYPRRINVVVEGVPVAVAAAEDLIALKSNTGRQIDAADIRALQRLEMLKSRRSDD